MISDFKKKLPFWFFYMIMYSTHQAIKNTPSFYLLSYGAACLIANQITVERKEIDFFSFFTKRRKDDLQIIHTWNYIGSTPTSLHPRLPIKNIPFSSTSAVLAPIFSKIEKNTKNGA